MKQVQAKLSKAGSPISMTLIKATVIEETERENSDTAKKLRNRKLLTPKTL